jgi:PBP1b-binding outer membrane lipoprotein LpoB
MKKTMTFSLAILTILWVGSMCMGQEKAPAKRQGNQNKASAQRQATQRKVSDEQKAWQEKLKTMTPEQQQMAKAKRAFEASVAPWRQVRLIAAKEKATATLAAIDKIIADKEKQFSRRSAGTAKAKANPQAEAKNRGAKKAERQAKPKKKADGK